jgi:hypothetical protein
MIKLNGAMLVTRDGVIFMRKTLLNKQLVKLSWEVFLIYWFLFLSK